jgi:hypothetical protein
LVDRTTSTRTLPNVKSSVSNSTKGESDVIALALASFLSPGLALAADKTLNCTSLHCTFKERVEPSATTKFIGQCSGGAGKTVCDSQSDETTCVNNSALGECTCTNTKTNGVGYVEVRIAC